MSKRADLARFLLREEPIKGSQRWTSLTGEKGREKRGERVTQIIFVPVIVNNRGLVGIFMHSSVQSSVSAVESDGPKCRLGVFWSVSEWVCVCIQ